MPGLDVFLLPPCCLGSGGGGSAATGGAKWFHHLPGLTCSLDPLLKHRHVLVLVLGIQYLLISLSIFTKTYLLWQVSNHFKKLLPLLEICLSDGIQSSIPNTVVTISNLLRHILESITWLGSSNTCPVPGDKATYF